MGEQQCRAVLHVRREIGLVDVGLKFVGCQHHDDIGPFGGVRHRHDLEALAFRLLGRRGAGAKRHHDVFDAAVAHVQRMGVTLAAVADHRDLPAFDQIEIGIPIVVDAHFDGFLLVFPMNAAF